MPDPPRTERLERVERDRGNPAETVVISANKPYSPSAYHDDADCTRIKDPDHVREYSREAAQDRGKWPCLYCVLGEVARSGGDRTDSCPYCPADDVELVEHLPCDGAEKDTVEAIADD